MVEYEREIVVDESEGRGGPLYLMRKVQSAAVIASQSMYSMALPTRCVYTCRRD
jgi:hypothetical protein